jgi:hypothetical protein
VEGGENERERGLTWNVRRRWPWEVGMGFSGIDTFLCGCQKAVWMGTQEKEIINGSSRLIVCNKD